jgi:hypothetical protein
MKLIPALNSNKDLNSTQELIFDKVAFTLPVIKEKRLKLIDRINNPDFYEEYNRKVYGRNKGRYKNNYQFTIDGNNINLSVYPRNKHHNFLRVEFNPAKLGKTGMVKLRNLLTKLLGLKVVKTIYFHASLTRLDFTLDVFDMEPNLFIHKPKVEVSEIFRNDDTDEIESQIVGSDASNCRVTMYDKTRERQLADEDHGHDSLDQIFDGYCNVSMDQVLDALDSGNHMRIEVRLRDLRCTMAELNQDLLDHFKRINFFEDGFLADKRFSKKFKNNAYNHGLNHALAHCSDDNRRRRYRRYLDDYKVYPIDFERLDFAATHRKALRTLISKGYRDAFLGLAA